MVRVLVSSFGPFGDHATNASAEVAREIVAAGLRGAELVWVDLPTVRFEAPRILLETYERERPDAIVMFGIAGTRALVTPERVAINVDDFRIPDNAGNRPVDEPIVAGGPLAYLSTLPVRAIVEALEAAGVPSKISNSAGTFVCNHVFYAMMHHLERTGSRASAGFVHIPQMAEAAEEGAPSLPFSELLRASRTVVEVVASRAAPPTRR